MSVDPKEPHGFKTADNINFIKNNIMLTAVNILLS